MLTDLEVSPDGSMIAARTQGVTESLEVLPADGSGVRQLTRDSFRNRGPHWSPDGARIYFYSNRTGPYAVFTIKPDGSDTTRVPGLPETTWAYPRPSPDGSRIALGQPSTAEVVVVPLTEGTTASAPVAPIVKVEGKWAWGWSPDGRQLLVQRRGAVSGSGLAVCAIPEGTCEVVSPEGEQGQFLPGGRRVACVERGRIVLRDLATRASRVLEDARLASPITRFCVSRDGKTLYFLRDVSEGDIWVATFP